MPYTLSLSSLSLFKDCPRCFWLQEKDWDERLWKRALAVLQGPIPVPSESCGFCKWNSADIRKI